MPRNKAGSLFVGLLAAFVLSLTGCSGQNDSPGSSAPSMVTVGNPTGVTPTRPLNAERADAATSPVRDGGPIRSWTQIDDRYGTDANYIRCVEKTLGISWSKDVPKFKRIETHPDASPNGTTIIVAVNTDLGLDEIRAFVDKERPGLGHKVPIIEVDETINTMTRGCKQFKDRRTLIRTAQAVPLNGDKPIKDIEDIRRWIYEGCKNPVTIPDGVTPSVTPSPSDSKSPSVTPSPSGSTTSPPETPETTPPNTKTPSQNPTVGNGIGPNPGLGEHKNPDDMTQPPDKWEDPKPPADNKPKPPAVTASPNRPTQTPTANPSTQPPNNGTVPTGPGQCGNPAFC